MKKHKSPRSTSHPGTLWLLKILLLVLGVSALVSGLNLILDSSGKGIRFPEGALAGSPFSDYLVPGILLTVFNGLLPLLAWWALWKKPAIGFLERMNPFPKQHWALTLTLVSGFGLMIWILVQMSMVPYSFLQPLLLSWGAALVLLCYNPGIQNYYALHEDPS
jgi:hypothetical protein